MEYIFLKVTRNSSSYKEMVKRIDTAATSMKHMEDLLNEERNEVKQIKLQLTDEFKRFKDDRSAIYKQIDNATFEVRGYKQQSEDFKVDIT